MKRIIGIVMALVALSGAAQEATVKRVELTNSIAASKYPMYDLNGRTAAIVMVQVIADNVEFLGSVLDGGVVRKTGEYWVYMGVGAKELHIHSDKFLPVEIRFPDYGIPRLEAAATYVVTLTLPQAASPIAVQATDVFTTKPVHLALCARGSDGRDIYITTEQWQSLPASIRRSYTPKGVCLSQEGETFLVELEDKENGNGMNWDAAIKYNLPTEKQAGILFKNKDALNNALDAFGGATMNLYYWVNTKENNSYAVLNMRENSGINNSWSKSNKLYVRAVAIAPNAAPGAITSSMPQAAPHASHSFSINPMHLALCATAPDGHSVYITAEQWKNLSASARSSYIPRGVCYLRGESIFIVGLHDKDNSKKMTWVEALKYRLPTEGQGYALSFNKETLNKSLRKFGGSAINGWYWTQPEENTPGAYGINVNNSSVNLDYRSATYKVREVEQVR